MAFLAREILIFAQLFQSQSINSPNITHIQNKTFGQEKMRIDHAKQITED